ARGFIDNIQMGKLLNWLINPDSRFGSDPFQGRNKFLSEAFNNGINYLEEQLGDDINKWQYGQEKFKHTYMKHVLSDVVNPETKDMLNLGPLPRGGNAYTVGSTGGNNRQSTGASFKMIVNTGDWDAAIATN